VIAVSRMDVDISDAVLCQNLDPRSGAHSTSTNELSLMKESSGLFGTAHVFLSRAPSSF